MAWRGLLRIVDFEALLTAQATVATALEAAVTRDGPSSDSSRTLRAAFNLLAKVAFTGRASIPDVHDLAWLDHTTVARDTRPSHLWAGERAHEAWERIASNRGRLGDLVPRPRHGSWADVPVSPLPRGGTLKVERGRAGGFVSGCVAHDEVLELMDEIGSITSRSEEVMGIAGAVRRMAAEARRDARDGVALVFVASA